MERGKVKLKLFAIALILVAFSAEASQRGPANVSSINGIVLDGTTGAPITGVQVTGIASSKAIVTEENGAFLIDDISPGRVLLTFNKPGYIGQVLPYTFVAGKAVKDKMVLLTTAGIVTGRLTKPLGEPASNVRVTL